ncbi:MAG: hypothetical protein R3A79_05615 [Nannocystaceae bacterium]
MAHRARSTALAGLLATGCFSDSLGATRDAASSAGSSSEATTGAETTSQATSQATTGTSTDATSSTSTSTSTASATTDAATDPTTTDPTTTGTTGDPPPPSPLVLTPEFAGCVLLSNSMAPYAGPDECAEFATLAGNTADKGAIVVDLVLGVGQSREARAFLRFAVPPELADATITKATLTLTVLESDAAAGPEGDLYEVSEFTAESLNMGHPTLGALLESGAVDEPVPGGVILRDVAPELVVAGAPLHLGVVATSADSLVVHGEPSGPDLAPRLTIEFE